MSGCVMRVPLWGRGNIVRGWALCDADDYRRLMQIRWNLDIAGYARHSLHRPHAALLMHRMLLGLVPGDPRQCDHRNRDKLDNRRSNLRVATPAENRHNSTVRVGPRRVSRFRGVSQAGSGRWTARVGLYGTQHYLGVFDSEEEAAAVAAEFRRSHMPYSELDRAA